MWTKYRGYTSDHIGIKRRGSKITVLRSTAVIPLQTGQLLSAANLGASWSAPKSSQVENNMLKCWWRLMLDAKTMAEGRWGEEELEASTKCPFMRLSVAPCRFFCCCNTWWQLLCCQAGTASEKMSHPSYSLAAIWLKSLGRLSLERWFWK